MMTTTTRTDDRLHRRPRASEKADGARGCSASLARAACASIQIEALRPEDAAGAVTHVFEGLSETSRHFRYLSSAPRLNPTALASLSELDPARHRAWVARCDSDAVGLVRIVRDRRDQVELAVEVVDSHAGRGVGRRLVGVALAAARGWGEGTVFLVVHPQNRTAINLFRSMGADFRYDEGILVGTLPVE